MDFRGANSSRLHGLGHLPAKLESRVPERGLPLASVSRAHRYRGWDVLVGTNARMELVMKYAFLLALLCFVGCSHPKCKQFNTGCSEESYDFWHYPNGNMMGCTVVPDPDFDCHEFISKCAGWNCASAQAAGEKLCRCEDKL